MPKVKPNQEEVVKYLTENASKDKGFQDTARAYAKSLDLSITTILNILKTSGKQEQVKNLYKVVGKKASIETIKAVEESAATAVSIKELIVDEASTEVVPATNPLDNVTLKRVIFEVQEGVEVDIDEEQIYIDGLNTWMSRDQVAQLADNAEKILEVYDYIYKN